MRGVFRVLSHDVGRWSDEFRWIQDSSLDFSPFARGSDFSRGGRFSMDSERETEASLDTGQLFGNTVRRQTKAVCFRFCPATRSHPNWAFETSCGVDTNYSGIMDGTSSPLP